MKISEYLKDNQGKPSSKRLQSYQMQWFFYIFNAVAWPALFFLAESPSDWILGILSFDLLLLVAIYTPAQLGKIQETKELIELNKVKSKNSTNDTE